MLPEKNGAEGSSYEQTLERSKKLKKQIIFILGAVVVLLVAMFLVIELVEFLIDRKQQRPDEEYHFYPTYEGNILENPSYLDLDRSIIYAENPDGYGYSTSITEENIETFDEYVVFLYNYLQTIIAGDEDAYNACFTSAYLNEHGTQEPFSPQMIYDMRIAFYGKEGSGDDLRITYQLDYRFHCNDGTFRRDVESDAIRPVYVVLVKDAEGNVQIDLLVLRYETKK